MTLRVKRHLYSLLLFFFLTTSYAQTYYWVGGSGKWNDPKHWSLTSGGNPVFKAPDINSDVVFDNYSADNVIELVGKNEVRSIYFNNKTKIYVVGDASTELAIAGNFKLSNATRFDAQTKLVFKSNSSQKNTIYSAFGELNNDIVFENGSWEISQLQTKKNIYVNGGKFELLNGYLKCYDFIATDNSNVSFINSGTTIINKISISNLATVNAKDYFLLAKKSNPLLYKVPPVFNDVSKVKSGEQILACGITTAVTLPTCPNICNGVISFTFDAGCISNPYFISYPGWPVGCTPAPTATSINAPTTFSLNNLCKCGSLYQIAVTDATLGVVGFFQVAMVMADLDFTPLSVTQPSCNAACNGSINGFISGGTPNYSGTVTPGGQTFTTAIGANLTNLCAGNYTLNITDSKGCAYSETVTMTQPNPILPNLVTQSISCFGQCTGTASVSPTGGNLGTYTATWLPSGTTVSIPSGNTAGLNGLCVGNNTVIIRDVNTCSVSTTFSISQPATSVTATQSQTNVTCGGLCNASASVSASGGSPGYTYTWSPAPGGGQGTSLATGLCGSLTPAPANYTVSIADSKGCTITRTFSITAPPTLTANPTFTNATCNGTCNGFANANPSGGVPPYVISWSGPSGFSSTSANITNLCAGNYTLTVTDASLCVTTPTVITITQPPPITLTVNSASITCFGACTGSAVANASGGNAGFTFTWSPGNPTGQGTPTVTNLCAGNYTIAVRDASLCSANTTFTISQPIQINQNVTTTSLTCNNVCTGVINSTPSGGSGAPYTFTLASTSSTVTTNPPYNGLCAGVYTLFVRDAGGCVRTQTYNIAQPNALTISANTTSISCFGNCNASLSGSAGGGTPTYTFVWTTPTSTINGAVINGQCAGNFTLTVTDANGCATNTAVTITQPTDVTVALTPNPPSCNNGCNGSITSTVSGGTPTYTYNWSTGSTLTTVGSLCSGNYTLVVTDSRGCTRTTTTNISNPLPIAITTTAVTTNCAGTCDGQGLALASGGTPGYNYSWSTVPVQTGTVASNLCSGNYVVTVTDSQGCTNSANVNITSPPLLTATISGVQPSCNTACTGSAVVSAGGGTPAYTYSWIPSSITTSVAANLCVGMQTVIITDSRGCTVTRTVNIVQTVSVNITTTGTVLTCNSGCTGAASANASGGTLPYTYTWTSVPTQTTQVATGLCAGSYTVTVADQLGCSNTGTISFVNPPAINVTSTVTAATCNSVCNGAISVTASGGTGALSYTWSPGNPTGQGTPNVTNLCAGIYTVDIRDANNCIQTRTFTISEPSTITSTFTSVNPTTCSGTNGSITATIGGGTPAYQFTWTPGGSTSATLTNVGAGTYTLTIRDNAGCTQTLVTTLSDPTGPTITVTSSSITCPSLCNGTASVSAVGTAPITFSWSTGATTPNISGLCQGTFAVNVSDATNCTVSQTFAIAQPPTFSLNATSFNAGCNSSCNGSITTSPAGGTPGYTVTWLPGSVTTQTLTNLCAGTYSANVTDANGCAYAQTFTITQPTSVAASVIGTNVLCNAACNGSASVTPSGGTAPYTFTWTPLPPFAGSSFPTVNGLCPGVYSVTVIDANLCQTTATIQITEPSALTGTVNVTNAICNSQCNGSASVTIGGGTPTYTFSWSGSASTTSVASNLCAGTYSSIVTDLNGCSVTTTFAITQPSPISVTATPTSPLCNSACNGSITTNVTGGTGAYSYTWIPTGTGANPTGLCPGSYTVFVRDANNCLGQTVTNLVNPLPLQANASFTNPSCNSNCNGTAISNPANGTAPFSYTWTSVPNQNTQSATALCAGTYSVFVSDFNGCLDTQQVVLVSPPSLTINPSTSAATCGTLCNGSINVAPSGGTPAYTFTWTPSVSTGSVASNICAGIYTVIVRDANNCSTTFQIPLSNSNGPSSAVVTSTNINCNGQCTGAASVTNPVGGTAPYVIAWVPPVTSTVNPATGLCAGTYTAQITDANSCILFQSVTITEPPLINANTTVNQPLCAGNCNGTITANASGGSPAYTYSWSTGATTSSITNICPGNYTLTVTDALNCPVTQTFSLPGLVSITSTTIVTNNLCNGTCNGSILASAVSGGIGPYTFSWSDPLGQNTQQAIGLCDGTYSVTITDTQGCFNVFPGSITSPAAITMTSSIAQPSCGLCNGSSTVTAIGGTAPFTYSWSNGATGVSSNSLCAGVYMITITDNNGCNQNVSLPINNSSGITGETINITNEACFNQCNGAATVTAVGGTAPITYNWLTPASTSNTLTGLCGGTYFVQMTDAQGCIRNASVTINSATDLTLTPTVTQPSCTVNNGSIVVTVTGGTPTYTFAWLPAGSTATLSNIGPGNYTVTVTDNSGCAKTLTFPINNQNGPTLVANTTSATCSGTCNAVATVSVTSGTSPFTYNWSSGTVVNSGTISTSSGLCSGIVNVTVTAANGCVSLQNLNISQPTPIVAGLPITSAPQCNGDCNGSINLVPSGGTLPYTYTWSPSGSTNPLTGLCSGTYSATITDANGCNISSTFTLVDPPVLTLTTSVVDASCNTANDGAITTTVTGGVPVYTYTWTGPSAFTNTNSSVTNILPGTYSLTLIDAAGCRKDTSITVTSTLTVLAVAGNDSTFCQTSTFTLNGSNSINGTTFNWYQVPSASPIATVVTTTVNPPVGTTTFVLEAINGTCIHRDTISITSNPLPIVDAGPNYTITVLTSTIIGGSPTGPAGSTFTWIPSSTLDNPTSSNPVASNSVNTTYTVIVTDANGCVASDTMHVHIFPEIVIPNGFSPNADGKNDTWVIDNIIQFPDCEVEVYNRWGEQLFYSKGYGVPWDGRFKGKDLPVGTYYYIINLNHKNFPKAYTGPLTIFR